MTVIYVGDNATPNYTCLSTDIVSAALIGASIKKGCTVLATDTGDWYIIKEDLTLASYLLPTTGGGGGGGGGVVTNSGIFAVQDNGVQLGSVTETAPNTDTASSGVNGRLQRVAQNLTTISSKLPSSIGSNGGLKVEGVTSGTPIPISGTVSTGGLTDSQIRATALPVSGTMATSNGLTDTQLRASAVPVSGPITDAQIRATALPISGTVSTSNGLTDTQLRETPVPVSGTVSTGGLTDTQLRASAVPVSGTFFQGTQPISGTISENNLNNSVITPGTTASSKVLMVGGKTNDGTPQFREIPEGAGGRSVIVEGVSGGTPIPVSGTVSTGGLTDTQLRASAVPVSGTFFQGTQPVSGTFWQTTQPVSGSVSITGTPTVNTGLVQSLTDAQLRASSVPVTTGDLTDTQLRATPVPISSATLSTESTLSAINTKFPSQQNNALPISLSATNFVMSTNNSTSAQLTASSIFTGVVETIYNSQTVSILLTSDKTGLLTIKQYIDAGGTKLISSWPYTIAANVPFSRAFTGNGNYFNLTYQNTDATTTTTLQIDTAFGILPATTNLGNGNIALNEVNGSTISLGQTTSANSLPVTLSNENVQDLYVIGQSAQTATVNNILTVASGSTATDLTGYHSASVQVTSTGTAGTYIFEGSNDNVNFQAIPVFSQLILTGTPIVAAITATSSQLIYVFPINFRYLRLRIATTVTGGSIQAFSKFMQTHFAPAINQIAQATAANLNTTIGSGTVTTVTTLTTLANGQTAHSSASTGSPVRTAGRVITTLDTTLVQGDASDIAITTGQQLVTKNFASSENDFQYTGILTTTTAQQVKAAGAASIRNFVTGISYQNTSAVATTILILDNATTIAQFNATATMIAPAAITFPTPLRGTAATVLNVNCGTTSSSVLVNIQGYQSF